jgi:octaprenyl-diphosphate synthase
VDFLGNFVTDDLARVDQCIDAVINSQNSLIAEVGAYIRQRPGKKLRPILTLLSSRVFHHSSPPHRTDAASHAVSIAAAIELIHTATLLHDDVIDKSSLRRGRPSVNARWGDDVAILMADYLFSRAFDLVISTLQPEALRILTRVTSRMCEGEMFQIQKRNSFLSQHDYLQIIQNKTAHLFSACSGLGSLAAGAHHRDVARMSAFGLNFGMAFQIVDDTLDFIAQGKQWGKALGNDLAEGKQTLPLIYALRVASPDDRNELARCFNDGRDFSTILRYINKYNAIPYTLSIAESYSARAKNAIRPLPSSSSTALLHKLSDFIIHRSH